MSDSTYKSGEAVVSKGRGPLSANAANSFARILAPQGSAAHCFLVLLFYSLLFTLFFSPVLLRGLLLAPGDGISLFLPNFYSHKTIWDPLVFGGFPMVGDPQVMRWYPPGLLASLIPGSWNVFVISAYVLASSFTYGYVYTLTRSRLSALVSGIVYGMSGFMMAHLGHIVIIHSVAWIPLIIWSLEKLRHEWRRGWFIAGALAVTFCFLGGHSQMFFYSLLLIVSYAVVFGWNAPAGRLKFYFLASLLVLFGIGLAALQIIPTAELAGQSMRTEYSFADFVSYSLPPKQLVMLIFPTLFGLSNHPTRIYFGDWNLTELTDYIGLLPLFLAGIGVVAYRRKSLVIFWLSAGLVALLLTLGDSTPLAALLYHVPVINRFRAPARHAIELAFAVSVLSGLGVAAVLRREVTRRLALRTVAVGSGLILACLFGILLFSKTLAQLAGEKGSSPSSFLPWENSAIYIPLGVFVIGAVTLLYWHRSPASRLRAALLVSVLLIDLGSFGWFYEWHYASPDAETMSPPVATKRYKTLLDADSQRLLAIRGGHGLGGEFPPNRSRLWGIPNATGNNVLRLARTSHLLTMGEGGDVDPTWKDIDNRSIDVLAVRYAILPSSEIGADVNGVSWLNEDMGLWLGSSCDRPHADSLKFSLPKPVRTTTVGIVSRLACSVGVADRTEVLRVTVSDTNGGTLTKSLAAGSDTSEWAYDCGSVRPNMRHGRATVFKDFPASMYDQPCTGHLYVTRLTLDGAREVNSIQFQWVGAEGAAIIEKVSLIDEGGQAISSTPIDLTLLDNSRWRYVETLEESRVFENLRAAPRVWLAPEVLTVKPEEALRIIKTSKMPDGRLFDPLQTALIEESAAPEGKGVAPSASARVMNLSANTMDVATHSTAPSFLVTSDAYYPGWTARLDGQPVSIFRTDYAIRGVFLPAGDHLVHFEYSPKSFFWGVTISAFSLLGMLLFAVVFKPNGAALNVKVDGVASK